MAVDRLDQRGAAPAGALPGRPVTARLSSLLGGRAGEPRAADDSAEIPQERPRPSRLPSAQAAQPQVGCIVLTQGKRPTELTRAIESVRAQGGVGVDMLVVFNGSTARGLPPDVRPMELAANLGAPGGRNAGVAEVDGDLLLFLDDDAELTPGALSQFVEAFAADPSLGLVQPRVIDPGGGTAPRRWVPRLRVGDPARSSDVCAVWEGAVVMRRTAFEASGGWPECFFLGHEGIDLAWRVWDAGFRVQYRGDIEVHHPVVALDRHPHYRRNYGRNRVWIARRNLPAPLAVAYCLTWLSLDLTRARRVGAAAEVLAGYRDGLSQFCGGRRPMRWRTAWRMTRAGRPPII